MENKKVITTTGVKLIEEEILQLEKELEKVRKDKNEAYFLSGDTWHDNPHFTLLEQEEKRIYSKIVELKNVLKYSKVIETNNDLGKIQIGSRFICECIYDSFTEEEEYEIVGFGESDLLNGKISYESEVGKNLVGLSEGDEKTFSIPSGSVTYKIIKIINKDE